MKKTNLVLILLVFTGVLLAQNNALDFDGTDDYVLTGSNMNLSGSTLTLECWVNLDAFQGSYPYISSLIGSEGSNNTALLRFGDAGLAMDKVQFVLDIGGQVKLDGTTSLDADIWYHVAGVYDGSDMKLYINGVEDASRLQSGSFTSNLPVYIASIEENGTPGRYLNGSIDEIRIWSDARTQSEIHNNMNNELTGNEQGLVAYYKLNESSGQFAYDSAGSNNGTLGSTSGIDTNDPIWIISDAPLPVNLSSFYALYTGGTPTLYWTTQTEENNAYWNVYRGTTDNFATAVYINVSDPVPGNGTTNSASDYIYVDTVPVVQNATYWYWIEDVSTDGETIVHEPITLEIPYEDTPITPDTYGLQQNYPNPFNPSTSISFTLAEDSDVEIIIYNVKGEKVKVILNDHIYTDQTTSVIWDGNDKSGKQVSSGVYFYKLITDNKVYQKKMLLVK